MTRPRMVAAALVAALAVGGLSAQTGTARTDRVAGKASACANAELRPATANLAAVRAATLCLINAERAAAGRSSLVVHRELGKAAGSYAQRMVDDGFFSHVAPDGTSLSSRIRETDYLARSSGFALAENIAWGGGPLATAANTVDAWMRSSGHRRNLLDARFTEAGVGIANGIPTGRGRGATYVLDLGGRGAR